LIEALAAALEADADVEAAWLAGSLGRGGGDAFSDVDILALAADGRSGEASARWANGGAAKVAEPVLVNALFGGRVVNVVTADWERFDVVFVQGGELDRYDAAHLLPLFNRGDRAPPRRPHVPYQPNPATVSALIREFLRVQGMGPVAIGRGEHLVALSGVEMLRQMTLDLMLEENRVSPAERGGALKRNPFLTDHQRGELEGMAPVAATREGLLAANMALAAIFLPRARRLAAEIDAEWPSALEGATRRRLESVFGPEIDWPG
jgi:predicted nucleotidyltransferase